jgi:hypothetical protein
MDGKPLTKRSEMARPKAGDPRRQISIHLDEALLEQLANAAKREFRSVSGEIGYRLRRSFEGAKESIKQTDQRDQGAAAAA